MIERALFGRTGHASTRAVFGAAALSRMSQERADQALDTVRAHGVNHIDTAAAYGESELRLAPFLADHRDEVFLATKTGERTGAGARASLERSLQRLGVDHVDLIQLHNLVEEGEWDIAHGPGGAVEALVQAREEGLTRAIGVTGHGLRIATMHRRSLERFDYDSVLLPYNYVLRQDPEYRVAVEELLELAAARGTAVQTIKALARRRWRDDSEPHFSWYEPLADPGAISRAVRYVLGRPGLFLCTSSDARLLDVTLRAAAEATEAGVPGDDEMAADLAAHDITPLFDGAELERI